MKKVSLGVILLIFLLVQVMWTLFFATAVTAVMDPDSKERFVESLLRKYRDITYGDIDRKDPPHVESMQNLYDVIHHDLSVSIDIPNKQISGLMKMNGQSLSDTLNYIYLNLEDNMKVDYVKVNGENVTYERNDVYLILNTKGMIGKLDEFNVEVSYNGNPLNKGFDSFAFKKFDNFPAVYTLSEPTYAPTWWPCKDVPRDKFTINMSITVPSELTAATSGLLKEETTNEDGTKTFVWETKYPMTTYLVSLNIGKYDRWYDTYTSLDGKKQMPVEYYTYPSYTDNAKIDWKDTPEMIKFYSEIFGEYPFIDDLRTNGLVMQYLRRLGRIYG